MGMTQGTPASVPMAARLTLQIATTTMPTTAMSAIFKTVRLAGGATRPLCRRRLSLHHRMLPITITTNTMPIQLTTGSIVPHINL